jgi:hypothetical protein
MRSWKIGALALQTSSCALTKYSKNDTSCTFTKFQVLTLTNPGRHRIKREVGTDYAGGRHRIEGILSRRARTAEFFHSTAHKLETNFIHLITKVAEPGNTLLKKSIRIKNEDLLFRIKSWQHK